MNGNKFVLDTNTIIYHLNGSRDLELILQDSTLFISSITYTELFSFSGLSKTQIKTLAEYIDLLQIVHTNNFICDIAAQIRRKSKVKLPDVLIAATCIYLDLLLITFDTGFEKIDNIRIIKFSA